MTVSTVSSPTRRSPALPSRIWSARALRDVDARGRAELAPMGRVRAMTAGEVLYRRGDSGHLVFIVTRGEIALERDGQTRSVQVDESFGAEPFVHPAARRSATARARVDTEVVELPAPRVQRVALRSQAAESALVDPRLVRLVLADAVARTGVLEALGHDASAILDGVTSCRLSHGEPLRATGDAAALVLHGALRETGADRHGTGALVTLDASRELTAVDHTWIALLSPAAFTAVSLVLPRTGRVGSSRLLDPARVQTSRSLLVLDGDACVRCGHCVASCASAHDDALPRLVRQGASLLAGTAFLVPGNCGHCTHAACLLDCPTDAITRDAHGAVQIREDLCTGCGRCVEACPWGNVRLATSLANRPVAVKCDLCRGEHATGSSGTPACVASCPTEALVRIRVDRDVRPECLDAAVARALARDTAGTVRERALAGVLVLGAIAGSLLATSRACGYAATMALVSLAAHGVLKRRARGVARSYRLHLVLATMLVPLLARHVTGSGAGGAAPSALAMAAFVALLSGLYGAIVYALAPRRLTALGDDGTPPDDLARELTRAHEQAFLLLTGRDERVKTWWRLRLSSYATSRSGALRFALSRAAVVAESERLRAEVLRAGQGRLPLEAVDPLIQHAVRARVVAARLALHHLLRGWLPLHIAASVITLALLLRHVVLHVLFH